MCVYLGKWVNATLNIIWVKYLPNPVEVSYWIKGVLTLPSSVVQMTSKKKAKQEVDDLVIQHQQIVGTVSAKQCIRTWNSLKSEFHSKFWGFIYYVNFNFKVKNYQENQLLLM